MRQVKVCVGNITWLFLILRGQHPSEGLHEGELMNDTLSPNGIKAFGMCLATFLTINIIMCEYKNPGVGQQPTGERGLIVPPYL